MSENQKSVPERQERKAGRGGLAWLLILALLGGGGYGIGRGAGIFDGDTGQGPGEQPAAVSQQSAEEELSDTVIIRIEETSVTVNGKEFTEPEELKTYLESIYTDDRIFVLEDENAILGTYEWVEEVCDELGISLKK
jgi:hypothetical protein